MLKYLTENVDNIQEHRSNINLQIEFLRKDQEETLKKDRKKKKNNVEEMKNVFDTVTNGISMSEKRISGLKDMLIETSQTKLQGGGGGGESGRGRRRKRERNTKGEEKKSSRNISSNNR